MKAYCARWLQAYCPTFTRAFLWLWHSPTFTSWGNTAIRSLRLLLVTPLILTRFDEVEIAAWYLFASLNFFGDIITQRLSVSFTRMFAFAMGGASNLAPIKGKQAQENSNQPNWGAFERAYGTIGSLHLGVAFLNVAIGVAMGWFALGNLMNGYGAEAVIWLAFGLMQLTSLICVAYQRYSIALQGMNYVALSNRWNILFNLLSVAAGSLALWLGGGILVLVLVMQLFRFFGVLRARFLLNHVEEGRVTKFQQYGFDREVFGWAWEPTWRGFIRQFGLNGGMQLTGIIYTFYGTKLEVASFLFSLRMLQTINQIASTPYRSIVPMMSRLLAAGDIEKLRPIVRKRSGITLAMTASGVLFAGVLLPFLLDIIGSSVQFMDAGPWFVMGALALIIRFCVVNMSICGLGNHVIFFWDLLASALLTVLIMIILGDSMGSYGPALAIFLPQIAILNIRPFLKAKQMLFPQGKTGWLSDFSIIFGVFVIAALVITRFVQ